jgi:hypothetical protein
MYLGDYPADQAIYFMWSTNNSNGASITRATDGTISVYKDNSDGSSFDQTQVTTGVTNDEDVDGLTGIHSCSITTTDAWYETGHDYTVVLSAATIDGQTVNAVLAHFSIENRFMRGTNSAATATALATAQSDLDTITGSDGVTLATTQGNYAPAKAGDSMDMSSISGDSTAADNLEADYDGTGYAKKETIILSTTIASVTTADTVFTLTASGLGLDDSSSNDARNGSVVSIEDATGSEVQVFKIADYVGSTKTVTLDKECTFPLAAGDIVKIYAGTYAPAAAEATLTQANINSIADQVWDELEADHDTEGTTGYRQKRSDRHWRM